MEMMDRRILYCKPKPERQYLSVGEAMSFCKCNKSGPLPVSCDCGEDNGEFLDWVWDEQAASSTTLLSNGNRDVQFHPGYSSGTAAIRGNTPFKKGYIHYWEVRMLSPLYGTDVMVGVGTSNAQLDKATYTFCSLLGSDKESWGFSYTGKCQHNGKWEWYGPPFGKGSIIGVYLDMWKGTVEFYLNRKPLGIAYKSLQGMELYPIVCSTAAQSAMRVTFAMSQPVGLKLLSLQALRNDTEMMHQLALVPGLKNFLAKTWWIGSGVDDYSQICLTRRFPHELFTRLTYPNIPRDGLIECIHQSNRGGPGVFREICLYCDFLL